MFQGAKRFRSNPVFDSDSHPLPTRLKLALGLACRNFNSTRSRNLEIFYQDDNKDPIYGLMTHYESQSFCWLQLSRTKSEVPEHEYDQYIRHINKDNDKAPSTEIRPGLDVIARYERDNHWYRGIIIQSEPEDKWLVFFIDYGNFQATHSTDISNIVLEAKYNHYYAPMQAVCCRVYNVVPRLPEYRDDIDIYLERFYNAHCGSFLEVEKRNIREDYVVDCDIFLPKAKLKGPERLFQRHIAFILVEAGLATFVDPKAAHMVKSEEPSTSHEPGQEATRNHGSQTKQDTEQSLKSGTKPETKPEMKPEVKPDIKPSVLFEQKLNLVSKLEPKQEQHVKSEFEIKIKEEPKWGPIEH